MTRLMYLFQGASRLAIRDQSGSLPAHYAVLYRFLSLSTLLFIVLFKPFLASSSSWPLFLTRILSFYGSFHGQSLGPQFDQE